MIDYDFTGKIHAISLDYGACCVKLDQNNTNNRIEELYKFTNEFLRQYAEYLMKFDQEWCASIILRQLNGEIYSTEKFQLIYRPEMSEYPDLEGTYALKFKRCEKDNL